jgi:hypothetical protein
MNCLIIMNVPKKYQRLSLLIVRFTYLSTGTGSSWAEMVAPVRVVF